MFFDYGIFSALCYGIYCTFKGTTKQPVFGIFCRNGYVWAEIVPDVESETLLPLIRKRVKRGSTVYSDTWRGYTGIAAKGYIHRLVEHNKEEFSDKRGGHINGLEGFWGYLKRNLASKGGIRRERLPLYPAEYVWRFNHRNYTIDEQAKTLLNLLYKISMHKHETGGTNGTLPLIIKNRPD